MSYKSQAELVALAHLLYVLFVVFMVPLALVGGWRGWAWVRNSWLRNIHLLMIGIVVLETALGISCPLTVWQNALEIKANILPGERSMLGQFVNDLLFYDVPPWLFSLIYFLYGAAVLLAYLMVPPRWLQTRWPFQRDELHAAP